MKNLTRSLTVFLLSASIFSCAHQDVVSSNNVDLTKGVQNTSLPNIYTSNDGKISGLESAITSADKANEIVENKVETTAANTAEALAEVQDVPSVADQLNKELADSLITTPVKDKVIASKTISEQPKIDSTPKVVSSSGLTVETIATEKRTITPQYSSIVRPLSIEKASTEPKSEDKITITKESVADVAPVAPVAPAITAKGLTEKEVIETADVGQCYGKAKLLGTYKNVAEEVVVKPAEKQTYTIPATYKTVSEEVVVKEASKKFVEIPATYKNVTETVVVEAERTESVTIPATYKTVTERVMVQPARKVWKKGNGLIEKEGSDGEIMCLVEEPAVYKNVEKQVVVSPERIETRKIPAVTKNITKQVVATPAQVQEVVVPAVKNVVTKKVVDTAERTGTKELPAITKTVSKRVTVTDDKIEWLPVLCDRNITTKKVMEIQTALANKGFYNDKIDGEFGSRTSTAVSKYQRSLNIESSGITLKTLQSLGVTIN